jgi:hypothetical protein
LPAGGEELRCSRREQIELGCMVFHLLAPLVQVDGIGSAARLACRMRR